MDSELRANTGMLAALDSAMARPTCGPACDDEAPEAVLAELDRPHDEPATLRRGWPIKEYLASGAVRGGLLHRLAKYSPARAAIDPKDSPEMRLGRLVHCLALTPQEYDGAYLRCNHGGRSKEGRKEREEAEAAGLDAITEDELTAARAMVKALTARFPWLGVERADNEVSVLWREAGVLCSARPDALKDDGGIWALKTCRDAEPRAFSYQANKMGYMWEVAWAWRGLGRDLTRTAEIVAVQSEPPYDVSEHIVAPSTMLALQRNLDAALATYRTLPTDRKAWPSGYAGENVLRTWDETEEGE